MEFDIDGISDEPADTVGVTWKTAVHEISEIRKVSNGTGINGPPTVYTVSPGIQINDPDECATEPAPEVTADTNNATHIEHNDA